MPASKVNWPFDSKSPPAATGRSHQFVPLIAGHSRSRLAADFVKVWSGDCGAVCLEQCLPNPETGRCERRLQSARASLLGRALPLAGGGFRAVQRGQHFGASSRP